SCRRRRRRTRNGSRRRRAERPRRSPSMPSTATGCSRGAAGSTYGQELKMDHTAKITGPHPAGPEVERDWARSAWTVASWIVLGLLLAWSWFPTEMSRWTLLFTDAGNMAEYAGGFAHPDFSEWRYYMQEIVV